MVKLMSWFIGPSGSRSISLAHSYSTRHCSTWKYVLVVTLFMRLSPIQTCESGWLELRKGSAVDCYYIIKRLQNYEEARQSCNDMYAIVAAPRDQTEGDFFNHYVWGGQGTKFFWIGVTANPHKNGELVWLLEDDAQAKLFYWRKHEPSDPWNERCVGMHAKNDQWYDLSCSNRYFPICRRPQCSGLTYGYMCSSKCAQCLGNGECDDQKGECLHGCQPGYLPKQCYARCPRMLYGQDCRKKCSSFCGLDGNCDFVNGNCIDQCKPGYLMPSCVNPCRNGFYGGQCSKACNKNCRGSRGCNHVDGACLDGCNPGFMNTTCNVRCEMGRYGKNCAKKCRTCKLNEVTKSNMCSSRSGYCYKGCISGYTGNYCKSFTSDTLNAFGALVKTMLYVLTVIFVLTSCVQLLKPKSKDEEEEEEEETEEKMSANVSWESSNSSS